MALRLYPGAIIGTTVSGPAFSPEWNQAHASALRKALKTTPNGSGNTTADIFGETSLTNGWTMAAAQFVCATPLAAGLVSGQFRAVVLTGEDQTTANCFTMVKVSIWDSTMTTRRGLLFEQSHASENTLSQISYAFSGMVTPVVAQAGDLVVFEIGGRFDNTTASSRSIYVVSHEIAPDLPFANSQAKTAGRGWVEFDQDIFTTQAVSDVEVVESVVSSLVAGTTVDGTHGLTFTETPAAGDVVVIAVTTSSASGRVVSSISGLGATWAPAISGTRNHFWVGTGATAAGDVTVTIPNGNVVVAMWLVRGASATFTADLSSSSFTGPALSAGPGQFVAVAAATSGATALTPTPASPASPGWETLGLADGRVFMSRTPTSTEPHQVNLAGTTSNLTNLILVLGDDDATDPLRLYLPSTGTAPVATNAGAGWVNPGGLNPNRIGPLLTTKSGSALTDKANTETSAVAVNVANWMWVSEPLAAQDLRGGFAAVIRGLESDVAKDAYLQAIIRVVSNDGSVVRATLFSGLAVPLNDTVGASAQEWDTTASTRIFPSGSPLTPYACVTGDRLTVELGTRSTNLVTTSYSHTIRIGDPAAPADFALTAGLTTDLVPWIEFSHGLEFEAAGATDWSGWGVAI